MREALEQLTGRTGVEDLRPKVKEDTRKVFLRFTRYLEVL